MKKIYIIYTNYLNNDEKTVSIGGIQTYISDLCEILKRNEIKPIIIQKSEHDFCVEVNNIEIRGIKVNKNNFSRKAISIIDKKNIVIFGSHELIEKYDGYSLAIQHGITWDVPHPNNKKSMMNFLMIFRRAFQSFKLYRKISLVDELICVDYNFLNWYRTQVAYPDIKMSVIPNYTIIPNGCDKNNGETIKIIFARRLFWYRGTRVFANAIQKIIDIYPNVFVTIAGEGPDEEYMRRKLSEYKNVEFIKYKSAESIKIHSDKDIAVIPTIGSEGTSLSLLEAMSTKCAVVVSNVGGMTNIVIDNYNGLIIDPNQNELVEALIRLIEDKTLRNRIADEGYNSVKNGFSKEIWTEKWGNIIEGIIEN